MKKKGLFLTAALLISTLSVNYLGLGSTPKTREAGAQVAFANEATETITVGQMADFLSTKKEHYPFSDQFMERYQQTSGGYLDNAKGANVPVDRQQHSPNQKWHFFESWYYPSLADGTLTREDDAKSRIYTKLLCPELLLWIYEACGVAPSKVKQAMEAAEAGKTSGTAVTSIAKNMRACVSWEDIAKAFEVSLPAESVTLDKTELAIKVNETALLCATVTPSNTTDGATWEIVEGSDVVSLTPKSGEATVRGLKAGAAKIRVSYGTGVFAECVVTVAESGETPPAPIPSSGAYTYGIVYDLGSRVTAKQIDTAEEVFAVFTLEGEGAGIITSVSDIAYVYGGAHGGKNETKWYTEDILKLGTTSANGSLTLHLSGAVNYVKITGYVYDDACKLTVGGVEYVCSDMTVASKETVEGGQASTALITFADTDTLTISTTNKKPLFILSIELGYDSSLAN